MYIVVKTVYLIILFALVVSLLFGQAVPLGAASPSSPTPGTPITQAASYEVLRTQQMVDESDSFEEPEIFGPNPNLPKPVKKIENIFGFTVKIQKHQRII